MIIATSSPVPASLDQIALAGQLAIIADEAGLQLYLLYVDLSNHVSTYTLCLVYADYFVTASLFFYHVMLLLPGMF